MATNSQIYLGATDGITSVINNIAKSVSGLIASLATISTIGIFTQGVKINIDTQTATLGIAGLIASLETFKDASGKMVEGPQKFALATKAAQADVQKLRLDALKTGANFKEVQSAYTQALSPGLSKGMNRDQIRELSTLTANASKSMGQKNGQSGQEIRSLLSGQISADSEIANALGLGANGPLKDAYKQAMDAGKGYEFLKDKLKEFNEAGKAYSDSLAGTFDQFGDVFEQFAGKASEGLTQALAELRKPLQDLFNQDTGEWDDSLQPILALYNEIGESIGTGIVDAVSTVVEWVKEFGDYLNEDQTIINTMVSLWDGMVDVLSSIFGIVGAVFGVIGDIVGGIMNALGLSSQTGEELTGWQKAMLLVNGAAQGLAVIFAALKDVIVVIANFIRTALGGAIQAVAQILQGFILMVAKGLSLLQLNDAAKSAEDFAKRVGAGADAASKKVVGLNNSFADLAKGKSFANVTSEAFKGTTDQLAKSADAFDKGNQKENKPFLDWKKKLDDQKAERAKALKDGNGGLPAGFTEKASYASTGDKKKGAKGAKGPKPEDTEKLAYENELNDLKTALQKEKDEYDNHTKWLELDHSNNLISLQDYFSKKQELDDNDYKAQLDFIDKSIKAVEEQKKNAKSTKDLNKLDKDENSLMVQRAKLEQDYAFNKHKNTLDQIKDLREYSNKLLDLDAQINEMTGKSGESRTIKLKIEIENLKEQYKADPEALAKISQIEKLKQLQLDYNNVNEEFNYILDAQNIKEDKINQSQTFGRLSELQALKDISKERKKNIDLLTEQVEKLDAVYNNTKDPALINQIDSLRNKLQSLKDEVDPIKNKFDSLFYDSLSSGLADFISGTKSAGEAWKDFSKVITQEISKLITSQAVGELKNLFGLNTGQSNGSTSPGGIVSSLLNFGGSKSSGTETGGATGSSPIGGMLSSIGSWIGGWFASGGYTDGTKPIMVGEGGPELFFPGGRGGYIANTPMTNSMLSNGGSGGQNITQNINIITKDSNSFTNSSNQIKVQMAQALQSAGRDM